MAYSDHEHLHGFGLSLEVSTDGVTYAFIDDFFELGELSYERGKSDDFTLQSADQVKKTSPGWQTPKDIPATTYLHRTQHVTLKGYYDSRTNPLYWRATLPKLSTETTASTYTWQGWVSSYRATQAMAAGGEEKFKCMWTITPTTKITYVPGS